MRTAWIRVSAIGLLLVSACQSLVLGDTESHKCLMSGGIWIDEEETCRSRNYCEADSDCFHEHRCEENECRSTAQPKPYCREDFDCRLEHGDEAGCCRNHACVYCSKQ
jgi:hypothetical protein